MQSNISQSLLNIAKGAGEIQEIQEHCTILSQNHTIPEPPQHSCPWTPPVWAQNLSPVSSKRQNLDIKDEISYITFKIRIQFEF